jgi:hypothetical protein
MMNRSSDVTRILSEIEQGDPRAAEQLFPLVYDKLRKLAAVKLAMEKPGQTLQPAVLRVLPVVANMAVAILFTTLMRHLTGVSSPWSFDITDAAAVALAMIFFAGSRDTLAKYYRDLKVGSAACASSQPF